MPSLSGDLPQIFHPVGIRVFSALIRPPTPDRPRAEFDGMRKIQGDAALARSRAHVARHDLAAPIHSDSLQVADHAADAIQCRNHVLTAAT